MGVVLNEVYTMSSKMETLEDNIQSANEHHRQLHRNMDHHMEVLKSIQYWKVYMVIIMTLLQAFIIQSMVKQQHISCV